MTKKGRHKDGPQFWKTPEEMKTVSACGGNYCIGLVAGQPVD
jgi:hypothetical protein